MPRLTCKVANCTVAVDAQCVEGRGSDCPNLTVQDSENITRTLPPTADEVKLSTASSYPPRERLYLGLPLEIGDAREFSTKARAIVVTVAGMIESGKTSLLARLHQQFQGGPVGGYDFAGSRTLPRFEELNWLATVESGVGKPRMEHSSRQYDNSFLHLTVRSQASGSQQRDILLNDISGETFPEVISAESVCKQLLCVSRADHLAVLVDGGAIAKRETRYDHCAKAMNFVQRLLQTEQIGKHTILHLIVSKLDELGQGEHIEENRAAADKLETDFRARFDGRVGSLRCWRLAARPLDGSMPTEGVIAELFASWASSSCRYEVYREELVPLGHARDFSAFKG